MIFIPPWFKIKNVWKCYKLDFELVFNTRPDNYYCYRTGRPSPIKYTLCARRFVRSFHTFVFAQTEPGSPESREKTASEPSVDQSSGGLRDRGRSIYVARPLFARTCPRVASASQTNGVYSTVTMLYYIMLTCESSCYGQCQHGRTMSATTTDVVFAFGRGALWRSCVIHSRP